MFHESMIAPCGLHCALCSHRLKDVPPCPGCKGPDENKPECCRVRCRIVHCTLRSNLEGGFCNECEKYPCSDVMEKEIRYANAYPMLESPIGNLAFIAQNGMDAFLETEKKRWSCPRCGAVICVHDGVCSACGAVYTNRIPSCTDSKDSACGG